MGLGRQGEKEMTPTEKDMKELRPCPFCGFHDPINSKDYIGCRNSGCSLVFQFFIKTNEWQNAYCWKRIESLETELKKAVEALEAQNKSGIFEIGKDPHSLRDKVLESARKVLEEK